MKRARKATKATGVHLPEAAIVALDVATKRLQRAAGVLTAIVFLAEEGADIDLSPVAICARESIDRALEVLSPLLPKQHRGAQ